MARVVLIILFHSKVSKQVELRSFKLSNDVNRFYIPAASNKFLFRTASQEKKAKRVRAAHVKIFRGNFKN